MAANKVVVAGSSITASQLKDLFRQVDDGSLGFNEVQALLEHRNPFTFERNEHGHIVFTVTGLDLTNFTGADEATRLLAAGYRLGDYAKQCFMSTAVDSYDKNHRLVARQSYKIALMPGREIERDSDRTTANLRKRGMEHYGYGKPLAGIVPRYRERISDKQMEEMGFWYIATLHDTIKDSDGDPDVLGADRGADGRWVYTDWDDPDGQWDDDGAFAFPVPARS